MEKGKAYYHKQEFVGEDEQLPAVFKESCSTSLGTASRPAVHNMKLVLVEEELESISLAFCTDS